MKWILLLAIMLGGAPGRAQTPPAGPTGSPIVADLSDHLVAITTGFTGAEVLLFGAVEGTGDVVVTITGPAEDVAVRRKERVFGIWVNTRRVVYQDVPGFYAAASSKPIEDLLSPTLRARHQVGIENLRLVPDGLREMDPVEAADFRAALLRRRVEEGLYSPEIADVRFLGNRLFRTNLVLPAAVPTGTYTVAVYLVRDRQVVNAQTTPLVVGKIGLGAEVYEFAQAQSLLYGLIAVLAAIVAGWLAAVAFRKA